MDAVASEDMDTLAFGGSVLLRQLNAKKDGYVLNVIIQLYTVHYNNMDFVVLGILKI